MARRASECCSTVGLRPGSNAGHIEVGDLRSARIRSIDRDSIDRCSARSAPMRRVEAPIRVAHLGRSIELLFQHVAWQDIPRKIQLPARSCVNARMRSRSSIPLCRLLSRQTAKQCFCDRLIVCDAEPERSRRLRTRRKHPQSNALPPLPPRHVTIDFETELFHITVTQRE